VEKLKTVRERDVKGLGVRVETCHVCIERERKKILYSCAATGCCPVGKKKKIINYVFLMT
jgi:hypothetical protein